MAAEPLARAAEPGRGPVPRIVGTIGSLLIAASAFLAWIESPLRGGAAASHLTIALLLAVVAGACCLLGLVRLTAVAASLALALCVFVLASLSLRDARLWALVNDNAQYSAIIRFSDLFLPWNKGADPLLEHDLVTDGLTDRVAASVYFMGRGWWLCLSGALLALLACVWARPFAAGAWSAITLGVSLFGAAALLRQPLAGELSAARADRDLTYARFDAALRQYASAQRDSAQVAYSEPIWRRIGEAQYRLGRANDPSARFYVAARATAMGDVDQGIGVYMPLAQDASEPLRSLARRELSSALIEKARAAYQEKRVPQAIGLWERALALDPEQAQAAFYLSRAYFDVGRYEQGIAMGRFASTAIRDRRIRADLQCNIGDSFMRLNRLEEARLAYEAARRLDPSQNYRMFRSLGGT